MVVSPVLLVRWGWDFHSGGGSTFFSSFLRIFGWSRVAGGLSYSDSRWILVDIWLKISLSLTVLVASFLLLIRFGLGWSSWLRRVLVGNTGWSSVVGLGLGGTSIASGVTIGAWEGTFH